MPAMTARAYAGGVQSILNKEVDTDSDTLKVTLHTASYTPDYDTHRYVTDLTNELSTAGGYTAGGVTLSSVTLAKTAGSSWGQQWAASTAYTAGQIVRPTTGNGLIYVCAVAGTSSASQPTWPTTLFREVTDGSVVWTAVGRGAVTLDFADPSWASFTAGPFRYAIVSDTSPGSAATNPLLVAFAFAGDQTGGGGTYTINVDTSGAIVVPY